MGCECYQIGGPFIEEDPSCPAHGQGGLQEQLDDMTEQRDALQATLKSLAQYGIRTVSDAKALFEDLRRYRDAFSNAHTCTMEECDTGCSYL